MNKPLMRTKISVPRPRKDLIHRQRLLKQLNEILENKLIMVSAPAGYGKTTLMIDFASREEIPVCWYSLDENDKDMIRFVSHLVASISVRFPHFGADTLSLLKSFNDRAFDIDVLITTFVNELYDKILEHFLIVIDDFHLIEENPHIVSFLSRLIEYVDENCHFVVLSRTLLGLPNLPLLVARNQVAGLSFEELAFRKNEIRLLFQNNYQINLSKEAIDTLYAESEGWITGLLLTAANVDGKETLQYRTPRVVGVGIDEYLGQQILEPLSEDMRTFLFQTSLLEEFDAALCKKVLDPINDKVLNWDRLMDEALQKNLFLIAVPDAENDIVYLRFHHLFRDFLQKKMIERSKSKADQIRLNLANYYAETKEWQIAINILFSINQTERIAQLLETGGPELISDGKYDLITEWLSKLTGEIRYKYPVLLSLQGMISSIKNDVLAGINSLSDAIQLLQNQPDKKSLLLQTLSRRATAYRLIGDFFHSEEDIKIIQQLTTQSHEHHKVISNALREKALLNYNKGKFNEALQDIKAAEQISINVGDNANRNQFAIDIGMIHRGLGNYDEAERYYISALEYLQKYGNFSALTILHNNLAFLYHKLGRYSQAVLHYEKTIEYAKFIKFTKFEAYGIVGIADVYSDIQAIEEAEEAYQKGLAFFNIIQDSQLDLYIRIAMVRLFLYNQKIKEANIFYNELFKSEVETPVINVLKMELAYFDGNYHLAKDILSDLLSKENQKIGKDEIALVNFYELLLNVKMGLTIEPLIDDITAMISDKKEKMAILSAGKKLYNELSLLKTENPLVERKLKSILEQIKKYGESVPEVKRRIRQHGNHIPVPPAKIEIFSFGNPRVIKGGEEISSQEWQANIAKELLFYILFQKNGVTKEQIFNALWPDVNDDLSLRFKNTIYRLRRVMGKDAILLLNNRYFFNTELDYSYDVELFDSYLNSDRVEQLKKAIDIYKGFYLEGFDNIWLLPERTRTHFMYRNAVLKYVNWLLEEKKQLLDVIVITEELLKYDPEFEEAYRVLMKVSYDMGDIKKVMGYYRLCSQVLKENLDLEPSIKTKQLLETLTK
ncbi:MAG: hypothetical protein CL609_22765 [Anaerolineaceae bacterium]|nr:hypothetical protein [Anaerolineaceae bacterium]